MKVASRRNPNRKHELSSGDSILSIGQLVRKWELKKKHLGLRLHQFFGCRVMYSRVAGNRRCAKPQGVDRCLNLDNCTAGLENESWTSARWLFAKWLTCVLPAWADARKHEASSDAQKETAWTSARRFWVVVRLLSDNSRVVGQRRCTKPQGVKRCLNIANWTAG